jgi:hypothetical protein
MAYLDVPLPCATGAAEQALATPGACLLDDFVDWVRPKAFLEAQDWCEVSGSTVSYGTAVSYTALAPPLLHIRACLHVHSCACCLLHTHAAWSTNTSSTCGTHLLMGSPPASTDPCHPSNLHSSTHHTLLPPLQACGTTSTTACKLNQSTKWRLTSGGVASIVLGIVLFMALSVAGYLAWDRWQQHRASSVLVKEAAWAHRYSKSYYAEDPVVGPPTV